MKHKLIIFDWNGTLLSDTRQSWLAGNECLKFYGAEPMTLARYREIFTFPIIHFYKKHGVCVDTVLAHKDEANAIFQTAYESLAARARMRRGARDLLRWLQGQGATSIILSNYLTDKIEGHLKRLRIEDYFSFVSGHECSGTTILETTTKVECLSEFMVKRRYRPEDTVIIGDSMEEPEIARALGLTSIGITDGSISRPRLRKAKPDYIVQSLREIQSILTYNFFIDE